MIHLPVHYRQPQGVKAYKVVDAMGRDIALVALAPEADAEAFAKQVCSSLNAAHPAFPGVTGAPGGAIDLPDPFAAGGEVFHP